MFKRFISTHFKHTLYILSKKSLWATISYEDEKDNIEKPENPRGQG